MSLITLKLKIMGEKEEREVEMPDVLTLPVESFKVFNEGRLIKYGEHLNMAESGVKNGDKLTIMVTEKIDQNSINSFEKLAFDSESGDGKKKELAVLRLRKIMQKFANRVSLDDCQRILCGEKINPIELDRNDIETLVDRRILGI